MASSQESLFSLELVVEKLYLPYVTCRFPAVAFRLLDFPTILISHVEKELSDSIKAKINRDPYYRLPNQFAELQDKQGNFMLKKGKSCLFKISLDTLAMHLSNTPLYIMVIDEYPDVPKLLGNSSLALNEVIDFIKTDIRKNGHTVPSVHGDKGLFKIYSLMGKEIGYMILGFRLLSLGPGLIAHLPATALVKRASERNKGEVQQSVIDEIMEIKEEEVVQAVAKPIQSQKPVNKQRENLNSTREMGSMTDVEKRDALMQTVEMENEKFHVEVSAKVETKSSKTIETQTERRHKVLPKRTEEFQIQAEDSDEDDGILINPNINCPPPLFYNSKAEPDVQIDRDVNAYLGYSSTFDDATLEDLSGDEHFEKVESNEAKMKEKDVIPTSNIVKEAPKLKDAKTIVISNIKNADQSSQQGNVPGLNMAEPVFPLLTALLTELSKIQNPQFVNQAMQQVNQVRNIAEPVQKTSQAPVKVLKSKSEENIYDIPEVDENISNVSNKKKGKKIKSAARPSENVTKNKGWIRKAPEAGIKKTKLVFGLTNTQRLRLAKQNPTWLQSAEQEEKASKALKQQQKVAKTLKEPDFEGDTGNLSDTYTEVRRLAAAELAKATLGKSQLMTEDPRVKKSKKKLSKSRDNSPVKGKQSRSKSPKGRKPKDLKGTVQVREDTDIDSEGRDQAVHLDSDAREIASPDMAPGDKLDSAADSVPSSRLEVHIPSARANESDDDENTFSDSFEEETATDRKEKKYMFPGFNEGDETLPESIARDGKSSMNTTIDDDSPLESTRMSKQFKRDPYTGESLFKSTEDYDTKQFHSTDEPELQKLISEDEKTDTLPTPATDRSVRSPSPALTNTNTGLLSMKFEVLNPKASKQSPLPAVRRSQQLRVDSMNARPTPTDTPRSRSSQGSPKNPSPRPRKHLRERRLEFKKESIHTESVSSYVPSESENILSLISDGSYSDDFHMSSEKDESSKISIPELPRMIPSTKLGFTIA
ncbi:microtubule-associated protein 10-like [Ruditapes philippinarum]|uniref:microtubule-associated protein 10-like n=1 Tax=Ruditapes philippinarum TaxID=129788 RepID=UPI00295BE9F2|nr:microtubule-associated protein 10-like [Ruditapes philippinarum]